METIGFIGLGVMGRPMAKHILAKGYRVVVFNRSRTGLDELVSAGAVAASSPAEVAGQATVVITMVADTPDVEAVLMGPNGVLPALAPGSVVIDMSSISPVATKALAAAVSEKGSSMLDAPVSGGEIGAINATLSIMIGGSAAVVARVRPISSAWATPSGSCTWAKSRDPGRSARCATRLRSVARLPA